MSRPLFKVGEEVILCSEFFPEYNGDYSVLQCIDTSTTIRNPKSGNLWKNNTGRFIYDIGLPRDTKQSGWSNESSLRKKHRPADQGFVELMRNLGNPVKEAE